MKQRLQSFGKFFLRFGLSAILLGWLFSKIDYKHTWAAIKGADNNFLLAAFIVFFFTCALILWRWIILLKALNLKFERLNAARWFFTGLFFNLFLPTSIGGDVIKAIGLSSQTGHRPKVFASIVLDRLIGLLGIVVIASVSFLFGHHIIGEQSLLVSIVIMALVTCAIGVVLFSRRIFTAVSKAFSFWPKVREALMKLHQDLLLMKGKQKQFFATLGISMFAQFVLACVFYLTAKGLHQDIPLIYFVIFSPLVCVVTSLPSIGGLGVREMGWVYLLSKVGVAQNVALALSLINFSFMVVIGLVGGIWYVTSFSTGRVQHYQANPLTESRNS